jgi:hypothetical protein
MLEDSVPMPGRNIYKRRTKSKSKSKFNNRKTTLILNKSNCIEAEIVKKKN